MDRRCRACGVESGHIHQHREQAIVDTRLGQVEKVRGQCGRCGATWTCQPKGMKPHQQRSLRVMALNVLLYALGLSYEAVAAVLTALGAPESDTTVYRDVQAAGTRAQRLHQRGVRQVRIAGIDGTGQRVAAPGDAHSEDVLMVVDVGTGELVEVRLLDEEDVQAIAQLIEERQHRYGIQEGVSDEKDSYESAIEPHHHWLCTAHFKKAKRRRIHNLRQMVTSERMQRDLETLDGLLRDPPPDGAQRAFALAQHYRRARAPGKGEKASPSTQLKRLALDISDRWPRVWHFTNNATQRAIGRYLKIRSRSMRGFKVTDHIPRFVHLRAWIEEAGQRVPLAVLL